MTAALDRGVADGEARAAHRTVTYAACTRHCTVVYRDGAYFGHLYNRSMTGNEEYVDLVVSLPSMDGGLHVAARKDDELAGYQRQLQTLADALP